MIESSEKTLRNISLATLLKNTFRMGGTQVVHILVTLLKGKIVAILIGIVGTGLSSIYWTATSWIQQLSTLGLPLAAVKDIAKEKDMDKRNTLISLIKRFFFIAANIAFVIALLISPLLSYISFSDFSHVEDFVILSLLVWFAVMGAGELTLLQGLNLVKPLYRATLVGSITGVLFGLPFYWFLGLKGIAWALTIASATTFLSLRWWTQKFVHVPMASFPFAKKNIPLVMDTVKSGLVLFAGGIFGAVLNFALLSVIRAWGGIAEVGSYQSAYNIICQVSTIVFAAMSVDYFPKLSASVNDSMNNLVENQLLIGVGLTVPLMTFLMIASPLAVEILLSREFLIIVPLLKWFAFAMVLKAVSYPLGFIALAKAKRKLYFWLEVISLNILFFGGMLLGFFLAGLIGFGIALAIIYAIDSLIYYFLGSRLFGLIINRSLSVFILTAVLYTGLMLHLSLSDFSLVNPLCFYLFACCSLFFLYPLWKKRKRQVPAEDSPFDILEQ